MMSKAGLAQTFICNARRYRNPICSSICTTRAHNYPLYVARPGRGRPPPSLPPSFAAAQQPNHFTADANPVQAEEQPFKAAKFMTVSSGAPAAFFSPNPVNGDLAELRILRFFCVFFWS